MENIRVILDKIMDTPAISIANVERGIRLSALRECMKGGEKEKSKDISQVTFGEFLNKLTEISAKPPFEMELSFVHDWEYFRGKSDIWKELTGLNYNQLIETVSQLLKNEEMRKWFRDVVTGCDITRDMMADKDKTLESYYEVVSDLMRKSSENKEDFETYLKSRNFAVHIACNNIKIPLSLYAGLR